MEYRQMTIFDLMTEPEERSLEDMTEEEMVETVQSMIGVKFTKRDELWGYVLKDKKNKIEYTLKFSRYSIDDHRRFISVGYGSNKEGAGCPCDSIEHAVKLMKGWIENKSVNLLTCR